MKRKAAAAPAAGTKKAKDSWSIPSTDISDRTINPIRAIVDKLNIPESKDKPLIPLSIGDPTVFGNLETPASAVHAITKQLMSKKFNGYAPAVGLPMAREAIAKKFATKNAPLTASDVIITSGGSGAIVIAIQGLCSIGENVVLPQPGFSLYATVASHSGIEYKYYDLDSKNKWEVDLPSLEAAIDDKTRAIVVNNPSNPTGSNYSKKHLMDILAIAEKYKVPVIADEIYANMVFKGEKFHPMADLTSEVPILTCAGLAKQYLVPGWRIGWILIQDKKDRFVNARGSLGRLAGLILGACTLVQSAIPDMLHNTPESYYTELNDQLEDNGLFLATEICKNKCLDVVRPQGAMYLMIEIDPAKFKDIKDETEFAQKLLTEELVFVLPGTCFRAPRFVRVVTTPPKNMLKVATDRIADFCSRHAK